MTALCENIIALQDGLRDFVRALDAGEVTDFEFRSKQADIIRAVYENNLSAREMSKIYFSIPTGVGKTVLFSVMAHAMHQKAVDKTVLVFAPTLELVDQTTKRLGQWYSSDEIGGYYSHTDDIDGKKIIVSTYKSLEKLAKRLDHSKISLVIADEAHHILTDKRRSVLTGLNNKGAIIAGFTATPEYANKRVQDFLGTEIYRMPIEEAVENQLVSEIKSSLYLSRVQAAIPNKYMSDERIAEIIRDVEIKEVSKSGKISIRNGQEVFQEEIAKLVLEGRDEETLAEFKDLKTMIACPSTIIADDQTAVINRLAGQEIAVSIHSKSDRDGKLKEAFKSGEYRIAVQVNQLTEGFDDEQVSLAISYPTRSSVRVAQLAGRTTRWDPNNPSKISYIIDTVFCKNTNPSRANIAAAMARQALYIRYLEGVTVYRGKPVPTGAKGHTRKNTDSDKSPDEVPIGGSLISNIITLGELRTNMLDEDIKSMYLTDEQKHKICELYTIDMKSSVDIAKEIGTTSSSVIYTLNAFGIKPRTPAESRSFLPIDPKIEARDKEAERLYVDKSLSLNMVAKTLGVATATVYNILIRNGVKIRSVSEGAKIVRENPKRDLKDIEIEKSYVKDLLPIRQIAKSRKMSEASVRDALLRRGVERRTKSDAAKNRSYTPEVIARNSEIARLYQDEFLSTVELSKRYEISASAVWVILEKEGVPRRSKSESRKLAIAKARLAANIVNTNQDSK